MPELLWTSSVTLQYLSSCSRWLIAVTKKLLEKHEWTVSATSLTSRQPFVMSGLNKRLSEDWMCLLFPHRNIKYLFSSFESQQWCNTVILAACCQDAKQLFSIPDNHPQDHQQPAKWCFILAVAGALATYSSPITSWPLFCSKRPLDWWHFLANEYTAVPATLKRWTNISTLTAV